MKNSLFAVLPALALVAGCAATPDASDDASNVGAAEQELGATGFQRHVYRGTVDAGGQRVAVEVEVATTRNVSQRKICDRESDGGLYAGASVTAGFEKAAGSVTTRVRDAAGRVVSEVSKEFFGLSAYESDALDPAVECTPDARIANKAPTRELSGLVFHTSVPGVVAKLPAGDVWINPSYGGPTVDYKSFKGIARFTSTEAGKLGPRPFDIEGEELEFERGTLSLEIQPEIRLQVGWNVDAFHAKETAYVTLRK